MTNIAIIVCLLICFVTQLNPCFGYNQLPSRQGLLVKVAQESWKLTYKRLVSELAPQSRTGAYDRPASQFGGSSQIVLQDPGRYHLYLGNPCPWCHRVALTYAILGLSSSSSSPDSSSSGPLITVSQLEDNPIIATKGGWTFSTTNPDPVFKADDLKAVYDLLSPGYTGKITAPLLIDKVSRKIVSNESKNIVRMLGSHKFSYNPKEHSKEHSKDHSKEHSKEHSKDSEEEKTPGVLPHPYNLRPKELAVAIDAKNDWLYNTFNNAVYRAGFATEQGPYDEAARAVSSALDSVERTLSSSKYLHGEGVTESDIFLLPTVVRFDAIYSSLFKCTGRISEYPHVQRWVRDMYLLPGVAGTFDLKDAARSYYQQMFPLNPSRIVPMVTIPSYLQSFIVHDKDTT